MPSPDRLANHSPNACLCEVFRVPVIDPIHGQSQLRDNGPTWQRLARVEHAERRLSEALAIVDNAARETMLDQHPSHAFAVLTEDEQNRLYALLKGETR